MALFLLIFLRVNMHTVFKNTVKELVASGQTFVPRHIPGTEVYVVLASKGGKTEKDKWFYNDTLSHGGGACYRLVEEYRDVPKGLILLVVNTNIIRDVGKEAAWFIFGHEYGHLYLGLNSVELDSSNMEEFVAVEIACDEFSTRVFFPWNAVALFDYVLAGLDSPEVVSLVKKKTDYQQEIEVDWQQVVELMTRRRKAILSFTF